MTTDFILYALTFLVSGLYAMVGHGGASGYLAIMPLLTNIPSKELAVTALLLNIVVSGISFLNYRRAGYFDFNLTWPFLVTSIPAAFLGGTFILNDRVYYGLLSVILVFVALRMLFSISQVVETPYNPPSKTIAGLSGGLIGLLSGMIGVGGGIFLSPLMLLFHWADAKRVSATSAFFILANSIAGLAGRQLTVEKFPTTLLPLLGVAVLGGLLGSYWGSHKLSNTKIQQTLGVVLLIAALKMIGKCF